MFYKLWSKETINDILELPEHQILQYHTLLESLWYFCITIIDVKLCKIYLISKTFNIQNAQKEIHEGNNHVYDLCNALALSG